MACYRLAKIEKKVQRLKSQANCDELEERKRILERKRTNQQETDQRAFRKKRPVEHSGIEMELL
jgi:hypothetical protein